MDSPRRTVDDEGTIRWRLSNGKLHREDCPAIEWIDGAKYWYLNGKLHRENGPAIEFASGYKAWYIDGNRLNISSQEEFLKLMKLKLLW